MTAGAPSRSLHAPSCERERRVRASRPVFVISFARGLGGGVELPWGRAAEPALPPRRARCLGLSVGPLPSPVWLGVQPEALRRGAGPRRARLRDCLFRAAFGAELGTGGAGGTGASGTRGGSPPGSIGDLSGEAAGVGRAARRWPRERRRGAHGRGRSRNLGQLALSGSGSRQRPGCQLAGPFSCSLRFFILYRDPSFLALRGAKSTGEARKPDAGQ